MSLFIKRLIDNRRVVYSVKIVVCLLIISWLFRNLFINGIDDYVSYRDYYFQNDFSECVPGIRNGCIEQRFVAKGNTLSNITLYMGENSDEEIVLEIVDERNRILSQKIINPKDYNANSWNRVSIDCDVLKRNSQYSILIKGNDLTSISLSLTNKYNRIFTSCIVNGEELGYTLAGGMQFTYKYILLGAGMELAVRIFLIISIAAFLCFTVINFEELYKCFRNSEKKKGFLYAQYFSVSTVLLFNPLEKARNESIKFSRVIGDGFNNGVDVAKRTNSFYQWFLCFAIIFILFWLLANYLKRKEYDGENEKAVDFLDNAIVIANVVLALRCITYFQDESQVVSIFYYSDYILSFIILLTIAYILLKLGQKISVDKMEALTLCVWIFSLPVSIVITHEWAAGRELMGFQIISAIVLVILIKLLDINWYKEWIENGIGGLIAFMSFVPFGTSFYIELVTILNQHKIFWTHLKRNYFYAICIWLSVSLCLVLLLIMKKKIIRDWKSVTYPAIVFGFSCLWVQIPISGVYNANIFETANSSILISDFLNFGDIPIVQHYGGHMMTGVWEGIIYALLNNDYLGANFSPYADYIGTVIAILFFYLMKNLWNQDVAILITLFFPFYESISYWGLGLLMPLAAMAYVRKNTYLRVILFWLSFIWCAIYRLDLGFAFSIAGILALLIYIVFERNWKALRQLTVSLVAWGVVGLTIWCGICIVKGINPINRFIEFLMISLSNQNWARSNIGDNTLAKYAWVYIFVPFTSVMSLVYCVFSKHIRDNLGDDLWVLHLIIGLSYLFNFSRGLVRHSLIEGRLTIPIWSAYLFLSIFIAVYLKERKLILPVFTSFALINALFVGPGNFNPKSIVNTAVSKTGNYVETWTLSRFAAEETPDNGIAKTYWSKLREDATVIERVEWDKDLIKTVQDYQVMIDGLLNEGETFVDCINKTTIYPLLKRQNPVYVSQSPLQLSGQFTQEEFVKEIAGVPIVLMPCDRNDYMASESMDGIPNLYRYYKVFEYIYQNYVPLCKYEDVFAIWCIPEKYNEYVAKVRALQKTGVDITEALATSTDIVRESLETKKNLDDSVNLNYTGVDPMVVDIQKIMDLSEYEDKNVTISITYSTDTLGVVQMCYTTALGESFTSDKAQAIALKEKSDVIYFKIPVTKFTRIRLDIPKGSKFRIKSMKVGTCNCELIDYGYDGPDVSNDGQTYSFYPHLHNYELSKLPVIWAEGDTKKSSNNEELAKLSYNSGVYRLNMDSSCRSKDGNYLKVNIEYNGLDQAGNMDSDDETVVATIKLGKIVNGEFVIKYQYSFTVEEGYHDYMFRVSNDYYWYIENVNAVVIESPGQLFNVKMSILQGD